MPKLLRISDYETPEKKNRIRKLLFNDPVYQEIILALSVTIQIKHLRMVSKSVSLDGRSLVKKIRLHLLTLHFSVFLRF
jgi:hypothetical protein